MTKRNPHPQMSSNNIAFYRDNKEFIVDFTAEEISSDLKEAQS